MSAIHILHQPTTTPKLFVRHNSTTSLNRHQKWLQAVEKHILAQMANPSLSILGLAMEFFLSERQFHRKIKKLSGLTPNNFLREVRLKHAYTMLMSGEYETVKSVAVTVGYKRVDYFSNLFEARYNRRPLDLLNAF